MTEAEWLASVDPAAMLRLVDGTYLAGSASDWKSPMRASDRKLRLFACACARRMGFAAPVVAAEEWADNPTADAPPYPKPPVPGLQWCYSPDASDGVRRWVEAQSIVPNATRAVLLRDIVGNPFCQVGALCGNTSRRIRAGTHVCCCDACQAIRAWNDGAVISLAQDIYDDRAFDSLPILADALEEAGCTDAAILAHLRERCRYCTDAKFDTGDYGGPLLSGSKLQRHLAGKCACRGTRLATHVCGCWVVDLLLGKE